MTPEAKVKKKVKEILDDLGAYYTMPVTGGYGNSGAPDFIICIAGLFYGVECKANGGKATALQLKNHDDIRKAGGIAVIVDETNVENLRKELVSYVEDKASFGAAQRWQDSQRNHQDRKGKAVVRIHRAMAEQED
jgi:hypothetical protein